MKTKIAFLQNSNSFVLLITFALTLCTLKQTAQANYYPNYQTNDYFGDTVVVITPKKSRIFYRGMQNPIAISVKGVNLKNIKVSIDNGTIHGQNGEYYVSPAKWGNATITVIIGDKTIHQQDFRVKLIPDPIACVNGLYGKGAVSKKQLLAAGGLSVYMPGFDSLYRISKFTITSSKGNLQSTSSKFTNEQLEIIEKAENGGTIHFGDIHARGTDGSTRVLSTFQIKIK